MFFTRRCNLSAAAISLAVCGLCPIVRRDERDGVAVVLVVKPSLPDEVAKPKSDDFLAKFAVVEPAWVDALAPPPVWRKKISDAETPFLLRPRPKSPDRPRRTRIRGPPRFSF